MPSFHQDGKGLRVGFHLDTPHSLLIADAEQPREVRQSLLKHVRLVPVMIRFVFTFQTIAFRVVHVSDTDSARVSVGSGEEESCAECVPANDQSCRMRSQTGCRSLSARAMFLMTLRLSEMARALRSQSIASSGLPNWAA